MGFEINPYDLCVANSNIEGKQCTLIWHVDDIKISHMNINVVKDIISKLEKKFGKMTVNFGPDYDFIGIKMRFLDDKTLEVDMRDYLRDAIEDFGEDNLKPAKTPAKLNLFEVDESSPLVNEEVRSKFHRIVMKLMYVSYRGRKDIQLATAFYQEG